MYITINISKFKSLYSNVRTNVRKRYSYRNFSAQKQLEKVYVQYELKDLLTAMAICTQAAYLASPTTRRHLSLSLTSSSSSPIFSISLCNLPGLSTLLLVSQWILFLVVGFHKQLVSPRFSSACAHLFFTIFYFCLI